MAFDESVAARVRKALGRRKSVTERKMFGGIAFLLKGNMCCGVLGKRLVLRLGKEGSSGALREPHTRLMDFTGTPMKTMVYVDPEGFASDAALRDWVGRAAKFVSGLASKG
jgi:TfoX/Sxy family transcriptional regulator of competence genes